MAYAPEPALPWGSSSGVLPKVEPSQNPDPPGQIPGLVAKYAGAGSGSVRNPERQMILSSVGVVITESAKASAI